MDEEFTKDMMVSVRKDIIDCIEDAQNGELSPHWQEYFRREMQEAKESGYLPDDADILLATVNSILDTVPQINDTELNRRQLAANNVQLIYDYPTDDYGTLVEITFIPSKTQYTASVFLDPEAAQKDLRAYAHGVEQAVWAWVQSEKIAFTDSDIPENALEYQPEQFDDLKSALQYIFSALRHPEVLQ